MTDDDYDYSGELLCTSTSGFFLRDKNNCKNGVEPCYDKLWASKNGGDDDDNFDTSDHLKSVKQPGSPTKGYMYDKDMKQFNDSKRNKFINLREFKDINLIKIN